MDAFLGFSPNTRGVPWLGLYISPIKINLLEIQPVVDTMNAFREISSSQDDRERIIVNAQKYLVTLIHMAQGNAAYEIEQASCEAFRNVHVAVAETKAIQLVSERGLALGAGQAELLGGPQGGVLDADRARPRQLERVDVDALEIGLPGVLRRGIRRRRGNGERNSVPQEAFDDALGLGLDRGVALDRQQFCPGVENPLDAVAEGAPVVLLDGEMAAEVEERALADLVADALGADEAEGEVGHAVAGAGAAHEHTLKGARGGGTVKHQSYFMALHLGLREVPDVKSTI